MRQQQPGHFWEMTCLALGVVVMVVCGYLLNTHLDTQRLEAFFLFMTCMIGVFPALLWGCGRLGIALDARQYMRRLRKQDQKIAETLMQDISGTRL